MGRYAQGMPPRPLEGYPAYGAVHDVAPAGVRDFLYDFSRYADGVFSHPFETGNEAEINPIPDFAPEDDFDDTLISLDGDNESYDPADDPTKVAIQIIDPLTREPRVAYVSDKYDSRAFYRVFDPESLGVSVVEMDPSRRAAQAVRAIWQSHDFGAVENEARNEIGRRLPTITAKLRFNRVEGVGGRLANYPKEDVRQKIALMPDTTVFTETHDLIEVEAEIITSAIRKRLKQFMYPWDVNPHLTFAVFRKDATPEEITIIQESLNRRLADHPLTVPLGQLGFRHKLVRSKRR